MIPMPWDVLGLLGSAVGNVITDGWITMMLGLWSASLWILGFVLGFMDASLQPDIRLEGPGRDIYMITFALGVSLAVILSTLQVGVALIRRDGRSVGRLLLGIGAFWFYLSAGIAYGVAVLAASSAITRALMEALIGVSSWRSFEPWTPFSLEDVTDAVMATVLGFCSFFIIIAAISFFLIMVARGAALLVLAVTSPIAAAGLVADVGHSWLWKLARWFHAAAFAPAVVVLVLGIGLKLSTGVAAGLSDGVMASIGTAFASTVLIATSAFAPLALFKLLAFVDPGTASGASARAGWAAVGGLQGLMAGKHSGGGAGTTTTAASTSNATGGSQGEAQAQDGNRNRLSNALASLTTPAGSGSSTPHGQTSARSPQGVPLHGPGQHPLVGAVATGRSKLADGMGTFANIGAHGAAIGADVTNQTGVGDNGYYPDFAGSPRTQQHGQIAHQHQAQQPNPQPQPTPAPQPPAVPLTPSQPGPANPDQNR